ncbi:hypothetical protein, partial [Flavobacterium sp. W21_SRS_FM6]|uniref:hypothetical protein n=1 Tax=Flavobacterium sp. W21_SRS_FM6 TaxID=3240268 RepID=UPI003F8FF36D
MKWYNVLVQPRLFCGGAPQGGRTVRSGDEPVARISPLSFLFPETKKAQLIESGFVLNGSLAVCYSRMG